MEDVILYFEKLTENVRTSLISLCLGNCKLAKVLKTLEKLRNHSPERSPQSQSLSLARFNVPLDTFLVTSKPEMWTNVPLFTIRISFSRSFIQVFIGRALSLWLCSVYY